MGASHWSGPLQSGDRLDANGAVLANKGTAVLTQSVSIVQNSTNAVSATINIPKYSRILDILINSETAWNSASSAVLSVGITAGGTEYVGSVDLKATAGRLPPGFTGAQLAAMNNVGTNEAVVVTATPTGATSAGTTKVSIVYEQTERTS